MTCKVIRTDRRTLALSVDEHGTLIARAPLRMPMSQVNDFIRQKESWIQKKQAEARERQSRALLRFDEGERFPYLGGTLALRFDDVPRAFERDGALTLPRTGDPRAHALRFIAESAERVIVPRVAAWARATRLAPARLSWSRAGRRWGSMSTQGAMRLNLALMHCPMEVVDYVIVHELAHIAHPDHSPAFHALVRRYLPNEKALRAELRARAYCLALMREVSER